MRVEFAIEERRRSRERLRRRKRRRRRSGDVRSSTTVACKDTCTITRSRKTLMARNTELLHHRQNKAESVHIQK